MLAKIVKTRKHYRVFAVMLPLYLGILNVQANTLPGDEYKKVGEAKLEYLFWDVYVSKFYTLSGTYRPEIFPQALKISYLRDIDAQDLIEQTQEEWKKLGLNPDLTSPWLKQLAKIWPDIKEGDELIVVVEKKQNSRFYLNQQPIGDIEDNEFGKQFLRIWLDKNASHPELQKQLIGESK